MVDFEIFVKNSSYLNESPEAKYLNVIASFVLAEIGSRKWVVCLLILFSIYAKLI